MAGEAFKVLSGLVGCLEPDKSNSGDSGEPQFIDNDGDNVAASDDCNDNNPNVGEGDPVTYYVDNDGDGYYVEAENQACEEEVPEGALLEAPEQIDNDDEDAVITTDQFWYIDADNDGYADVAALDANADSSVLRFQDYSPMRDTGQNWISEFELTDSDNDGVPDVEQFDCDDTDPNTYAPTLFYADNDGDGFGDFENPTEEAVCEAPQGYVDDLTDCDDNDAAINTRATEVCDDLDNDCDGAIDDDDGSVDRSTQTRYYADNDGDGYGDGAFNQETCDPETAATLLGVNDVSTQEGDNNDNNANVYPGAPELLDGLDNDQDGMPGTVSAADADYIVEGVDANNRTGIGLAAADVTGDGQNDLIVGADYGNTNATRAGAVHVIPGPVTTSGVIETDITNVQLDSTVAEERFGHGVAAFDFTDDGQDDVVVSSLFGGSNLNGMLYLYVAGSNTPFNSSTNNQLNYDDSSLDYTTFTGDASQYIGRVTILSGSNIFISSQDDVIYLLSTPLTPGFDLTTADASRWTSGETGGSEILPQNIPDVDGDGLDEVGVSNHRADLGSGSNQGVAYLVFGSANGYSDMNLDDANVILEGSQNNENFGKIGAVDLDSDGYAEVVIGAAGADINNVTNTGVAYVFDGATVGTGGTFNSNDAVGTVNGTVEEQQFGRLIVTGPEVDLDGDGTPDTSVLIAAVDEDSNGDNVGGFAVVWGAVSGNRAADDYMIGENPDDYFGFDIDSASNLDGAGNAYIATGAYGASAVYLIQFPQQ